MHDDEAPEFWLPYDHQDLACRTAALHAQRRELAAQLLPERVAGARYAIAAQFLRGIGLEVGAGTRPFPLPAAAQAVLGDIRDTEKLKTYFNAANVSNETFLDAQSFAGINDNSQDFVISAHVIEHLLDPIGSIENGLRVIRPDGHYIIAVPDKRYTFDQLRPVTSLDHLLSDWRDGGLGTKLQAYREHLQYVELYFGHPVEVEPQFTSRAIKAAADGVDIHFHAWTFDSFQEMLMAVRDPLGFDIAAAVAEVVNESIFVLKKRGPGATSERALPGATSGALVRSPTLPGWVRRAWSR